MKTSKSFISLAVVFFIFILPYITLASTTGRIAGTVIDANSGEPLGGANIIIQSQVVKGKEMSLSNPMGASADVEGDYFIINVRPGTYIVECSYIGYQSVVKSEVVVFVDRTTALGFELNEQLMEGETITVVADQPMVRKDLTSSSAKISGEILQDLPVETFQEVLALQPGITTGRGGDLHIRGGRSSEIRYYVDGLAVSNPFNNSLAVPVENNAIQEVEVISGTFNAEYGQAQSGIVNIVTREGTEVFSGTVSGYIGDYFSSHNDIFWNIDDVDPFANKFLEANLSGPLLFKNLKFFVSGRFTELESPLYGLRTYMPIDSSSFAALDPEEWYVESTGDSQYVPMNNSQSLSGNIKLTYDIVAGVKLAYSFTANSRNSHVFNKNFKLNPDALPTNYNDSYNHLVTFTHALSPGTFYNLKFSMYDTDYKRYTLEDPFDEGYIAVYNRGRQPQFLFATGGIDGGHTYQKSTTVAALGDLNMMVGKYNFVKIGLEYRTYELYHRNFVVDVNPNIYGNYDRVIPPLTSVEHNEYTNKPLEIAAYIQDKIEINDLIVNVGLRFDYFDANTVIPTDFRDPANKLFPRSESEAYKKVDPKTQISPRLGLAFPITERGVVHAAYGQFFQIPEFNRLYENPEFEVLDQSFIGNADLEAQRTDSYEIGLQQELASFLAIDVTGYYRNIRNLLGSTLYQTYRTDIVYGRYVNNSHGAVKGFSIAARVRVPEYGLTADINYTYQDAKGIASDPRQEFNDLTGNNEAATVLNPLNWDLRNTFNFAINYARQSWGASVIGRMNSGYPFTPGGYTELRNQGRYQGDLALDLNVYKRFNIGGLNLELFTRIINVLDNQSIELLPQIRPEDEAVHAANGFAAYNTRYDYTLNPANQPTPREIRLGLRLFY